MTHYHHAGNTWGKCDNGSESVGCGNQETFINCADVIINSNTATAAATSDFNPWALYSSRDNVVQNVSAEEAAQQGLKPLIIRAQRCIPIDPFHNVANMDMWCMINCLKYPPNCHPSYCKCV
ncbi:hypothetical protein HAZT_HAZT006629 [Hyalella azteca]|uniref:Uncharacterized protein n=1 Tax=Hyalella azteca TaxID=294128 RepID=A0A6A0GV59_HYAAZ|nr:hypothetical protein HAZT_HAZT006629 [Hyalella azteca]